MTAHFNFVSGKLRYAWELISSSGNNHVTNQGRIVPKFFLSPSFSASAALKLVVGAKFQDNYRGAVFIYDADGTNQIKVSSSDTSTFDDFAISVAIGNSKIAAGMPKSDDNGSSSGSAFIYDLDGTNEVKITPSDAAASDEFGYSVAIGNSKVAIGARKEGTGGAVYVYNLDGTGEVKITPSDTASSDVFGSAVAIGNSKVYVGAEGDDDNGSSSGSVYIYNLDGTGEVKLTPSDGRSFARFGSSLAFGHDKLVVGAFSDDPAGSPPSGGSVYVYDPDGTNELKIRSSDIASSDDFGHAVAIGSNKIVVGAYGDDDNSQSGSGSVYVYNLDGTGEVKITASDAAASDQFGYSVAVGGDKIYVGARYEDTPTNSAGSVYIYNLDGTGEVKIPNPESDSQAQFGTSIALG
ncbi:virion structural protein and packaging [Cyanophage S-TIM5]|uniref:Virion structural protein and packaging n=1 Tax=Cyanophage S-TIM5 TaxID=1137745 RepID=H6WG31_9CAUD|nr:virion structural protein and packaging [Cyanophage S-TIM5]AEZ65754.1 virion structural protein and packaging [Cyanophage S-TIM5]UYE97137.1 virion structural protein [Cyanophage S-TIM61]